MAKYPYRILGTFFDRLFRNGINDNFKDIENDIKEVQAQVDNLVVDGDSSPAVAQALVDPSGVTYKTLKERLDKKEQEFAGQIEQKTADIAGLQTSKMDKNYKDISVAQINKNMGLIDQSYLSPELLQQMTGTTPVNSTVADGSVTRKKMADGAATINKLDQPVRDLMPKAHTFVIGGIDGLTGAENTNASRVRSSFIRVKAGDVLGIVDKANINYSVSYYSPVDQSWIRYVTFTTNDTVFDAEYDIRMIQRYTNDAVINDVEPFNNNAYLINEETAAKKKEINAKTAEVRQEVRDSLEISLIFGRNSRRLESLLNQFYQTDGQSAPLVYTTLDQFKALKTGSGKTMLYFDLNVKPHATNGILEVGKKINVVLKLNIEKGKYTDINPLLRNHPTDLNQSTLTMYGKHLGNGYFVFENYECIINRTHRLIITDAKDNRISVEELFISNSQELATTIEETEALKNNVAAARVAGIFYERSVRLEDELTHFWSSIGSTTTYLTYDQLTSRVAAAGETLYFDLNVKPSTLSNAVLDFGRRYNLVFKVSKNNGIFDNISIYLRNYQNSLDLSTLTQYAEYIGDGYFVIKDYEIIENRTHRVISRANNNDSGYVIEEIMLSPAGAEAASSGGDLVMYVSPTGNDSNDGDTKTSPLLSFQKAIDLGASTIVAQPGDYVGQLISASNRDKIKVVVQAQTNSDIKQKARLINSIDMTFVSDSVSGLFTSDIVFPTTSNWHKVFITKTLTPAATWRQSDSYNAILWETNINDFTLDYKMIPVLTLADCQATEGTFFYDGTKVYIHPIGKIITAKVFKRLINETGYGIKFSYINEIHLEDIEVLFPADEGVDVDHSSFMVQKSVDVGYSAYGTGNRIGYGNGDYYNCKGYKNRVDGFAPYANGNANYYNCFGFYNYDDGLSHHDGCTGVIDGGEYHHNPKGGVSPAHGAQVDIFNVISHHNRYGIYAVSSPDRPMGRTVRHMNNITYDNTDAGIIVQNYHVISVNDKHTDNPITVQLAPYQDFPQHTSYTEL